MALFRPLWWWLDVTVAPQSIQRLNGNLKAFFRSAKGRSIRGTIADLAPKLRGGVNDFRHAGIKGMFEALDGWIRRHLRKILWRQWKRPFTRAKTLMRLGLFEARAWTSATNGRGPWWNAGASHLNQAISKRFFDRLGLVSLMEQTIGSKVLREPPWDGPEAAPALFFCIAGIFPR